MKHFGIIKEGVFVPIGERIYADQLKKLEGKEVTVDIKRRFKQRSNQQSRYWEGVIVAMIADELGYTHDEMRAILKYLLKIKGSMADLTTVEQEEKCKEARMWAAQELNIYIPLPNEPHNYEGIYLH